MTKEDNPAGTPVEVLPFVIGGSLVGHSSFAPAGGALVGHSSFPESFAHCRRVARRANSSFPLAFRLLPAGKRRAMDALYAFMRVTDDLADEPGDPAVKRASLDRWRAALAAALAGRYSHPVHPALHDITRRFAVPPEYRSAVIDGVESDLEPVRFATFADLYPYCYRVASVVGLACVRVWGVRPGVEPADATAPAEAAGIAFQLTNILRDLGEDAARGRVYLPADEMGRFGCPPEMWTAAGGAFREMMRFQVGRARDYYRRAEVLPQLLSADGRAIFRMMCGTYQALLDEIERRDYDVLTRRVRVPRWRKGLIFLSAWPVKWELL
ncbi:MAG: squalene/phytoene synthase family protein [Gemmataceae bacterium]|nr:squalene/phytoene synthase family protein [Gemmataceae bacterium]